MDGIPLGPIFIRWNGILIMVGFAAGAVLASRELRRRAIDPEPILHLILPLLIWGSIGARLWHVFTPSISAVQLGLSTWHYLTHPLDLVSIWIGGLGFPGALIGGIFGLLLFCRKYGFDFKMWLDILAPGIALGQAIGRLGNYFNQELYGLPTGLPWKIIIDPEHRLPGYESVQYYHPLFAYESILCILNFLSLVWISRRLLNRPPSGSLFVIYVLNYSLIRLILEFLRLDVSLIEGFNINQLLMGISGLGAGLYLYLRQRAHHKL